MSRISRWDMSMEMAWVVAQRGTCSRLQVGAVIVSNGRVISMGYNGAPAGMPHCIHLEDSPCENAVHAEANAIAFAARNGVATEEASIFVTHQPCLACAKLIINAGIKFVGFEYPYRMEDGLELLKVAPRIFITQRVRADGETHWDAI